MSHNEAVAYQQAIEHCQKVIKKGSKSFSLAAQIFGTETQEAAVALYGWCRHCDDEIDFSEHGFTIVPDRFNLNQDIQKERLDKLIQKTKAAYRGEKMVDPVFVAFQNIVMKYQIPEKYPLDLLEGMAMDARQQIYPTLGDLLLYCYRVAGTVGLMMTHIMGTSDPAALKHAAHMGMAMQLTNISRDIMDDAQMGRTYLPICWLRDWGIPRHEIADQKHRQKIYQLAQRLLSVADDYYKEGDRGLKYLPFRAASTISAARYVYSNIGQQIRTQGHKAWDARPIVPLWKKISVMSFGLGKVFLTLPQRIIRPWKKAEIKDVWNYS